jgi:DNA-binding LytR/AlgR family response regulator
MSTQEAPAKTKLGIAIIDGAVGLAMQAPDQEAVAVILTAREADGLAGRLRKAANDLRASEARR